MSKAKTRVRFVPFDKQVEPLVSTASITAAVAGARGGKTQTGCPRVLYEAIEQEDYHPDDIRDGKPYTIAVGAPTFPMLQRIILPTFMSMVPDHLQIGPYHQTRKRLRLRGIKGESHIYFLSGKAFESWMGMSLYRVWLDEFAQVKEALFDEIQVRLSDRKGKLLLTGTPQGPNWAYDRVYRPWREIKDARERGEEVPNDHPGLDIDFHTWRTVDNPFLDRDFIEKKRHTMPARFFRRTFEATWETFEGQIYEDWMDEIHVKRQELYTFHLPDGRKRGAGPKLIHLVKILAGVDWGYANGHPGVIVVGGQDSRGKWWILDESVGENVLVASAPGADSWVTRAQAARAKWGVDGFICDTASPESIAQFRRSGLKTYGAVKDVLPGIKEVATLLRPDSESLEPMLEVLAHLRHTIDEFRYYHWKEGREEPEKVADHCMDAIRYLIYTWSLKGKFRREPNFAL